MVETISVLQYVAEVELRENYS